MKRALKRLGRRPDIGVGGGGLNRLIEKKNSRLSIYFKGEKYGE